jgi:hypothetical protein
MDHTVTKKVVGDNIAFFVAYFFGKILVSVLNVSSKRVYHEKGYAGPETTIVIGSKSSDSRKIDLAGLVLCKQRMSTA